MKQPFSIVNYSFSGFDEIESVVKAWNVKICKLNKTDYKGSLLQIFNDNVIISNVNFGNTLKIEGTPPKKYRSFGIPKINCPPFYWRNKNLTDKTIQIYQPGSELFMINKFQMGAIDVAVSEEYLYKLCKELKCDSVLDIINKNETIECALSSLRKLQYKLAAITETIKKLETSKYISLLNEINFKIPILLITTLATANPVQKIDEPFIKTRGFRKALDVIMQSPTDYHNLSDLCKTAGVSARTLQYVFKERLGVTPFSFIKFYKLNHIYEILKKKAGTALFVSDVANEYGFWHMGQFAKDYKKIFGELPSDTVRKSIYQTTQF